MWEVSPHLISGYSMASSQFDWLLAFLFIGKTMSKMWQNSGIDFVGIVWYNPVHFGAKSN
jgi:hypothetical protein